MLHGSLGIPWNHGLLMEYHTCHLCFLGIRGVNSSRNTSDSRDNPRYTTRKRYITSIYQNVSVRILYKAFRVSSDYAVSALLCRWARERPRAKDCAKTPRERKILLCTSFFASFPLTFVWVALNRLKGLLIIVYLMKISIGKLVLQ